MKAVHLVFLGVIITTLAAPEPKNIPVCESSTCKLPECQCTTNQPPLSGDIPQFVILSFDDSASKLIYEQFIEPVFGHRKNPDGCPITGTFFVTHQYTDYSIVNKLYNLGHEIGSHSVTKNYAMEYWQNATLSTLVAEMDGQRQILSKFANIPREEIIGARFPQLQLGEYSFEALQKSAFQYDCSWPTQEIYPLFPYSLDYASTQQCQHVQMCQTISTPGLWEMPIIDWISQTGDPCNNLEGCITEGTADEIYDWMLKNFNNIIIWKTPVTFRVSYSWFVSRPEHPEALKKFLDFLAGQKNVFVVSQKQALNWFKNPTTSFTSCQTVTPRNCDIRNCVLRHEDEDRRMMSCVNCPKNYPWLRNPLGD